MGESYFWKPFAQGVATPIVLIGGTNLLLKDFKVSNPYLYWGGLAASSAIVVGILADKIKVPILNAETFEAIVGTLNSCPECDESLSGVYLLDNAYGTQDRVQSCKCGWSEVEPAYGAESFNAEDYGWVLTHPKMGRSGVFTTKDDAEKVKNWNIRYAPSHYEIETSMKIVKANANDGDLDKHSKSIVESFNADAESFEANTSYYRLSQVGKMPNYRKNKTNKCFICSKPATRERGFTNQHHQEDGEGTSPRITDERGSVWFCKEHDNLYDFGLFSTGNLLAWTHPNGTKYVQGRLLKDAYVQGRLLKEKNAETTMTVEHKDGSKYRYSETDPIYGEMGGILGHVSEIKDEKDTPYQKIYGRDVTRGHNFHLNDAESFEAQGKPTWAGYCPFCKKWRTTEWSKKYGGDTVCAKIIPDPHYNSGDEALFVRENFARKGGKWIRPKENICGVVLEKKQSKFRG